MRPVVSFVIPVRNDATRLAACLRSIRANAVPPSTVEVIVIDNGSDDGSAAAAAREGARVLSCPNASVGELRNRGATAAEGRILAFVDADHEIGSNWIRTAIDRLSEDFIGAAGALCHPPGNGTWVQRIYDLLRPHPSRAVDVEWLGSGNLAVVRAAFQQVGGFDTRLQTCEDVDLCKRLRTLGFRIICDERMYNVHLGDPSTIAELFKGELWRGRDNLRVSFRRPIRLREIPSMLIPVLYLVALVAVGIGFVLLPSLGSRILGFGVLCLTGLTTLRTLQMLRRCRRPGARVILQAFLVAATYDLARALALVVRKRHRRAPALRLSQP